MSDVLTLKQQNKAKESKIVYGFIRKCALRIEIPMDIIYICLDYYHQIPDEFMYYNPDNYGLSKDNALLTAINKGRFYSCVYGII